MPEEDDVVLAALVAIPCLRQALNQRSYFRKAAHHHLAAEFVLSLQHALDLCFQLPRIAGLGSEDDIAAVDVGSDLGETHSRKTGLQGTHANHVVPAHVDPAQETNKQRSG